jgi:TM2 domain-containing membrane protein YozV
VDTQKVVTFLSMHGGKFKPEQLEDIRYRLENMPDESYVLLINSTFHDPNSLLIISIFGGWLGIDRFILNHTGIGVGKLLTSLLLCGTGWIWAIVDWFLIKDAARDENYKTLVRISGYVLWPGGNSISGQ